MDEVEEIKRKIDIVDLISSYLTLKKAGANYRALCPFHNEKTPSLMVSPEKQIFKCFGCNEGGDIFEFVMKMENLEFREALEILAQKAGVKLERRKSLPPDEKPDKKSRLFKVNALSAQVFHKILTSHPAGKQALTYLKSRKITESTIKEFLIGYTPSSRALKSFLLKKGFTEQEIQNAGNPDRFYKRIIFPITDVMGNVLGFTGRAMSLGQEPKYLNTPETIIFHKGRILYNLTRARGEIKLQKTTILVEGQMDVISSYQAGVKNVVATSGTALTPEHLQILYRYTPNITFAFDSDTAGLTTAKKAYEMALIQGFNVKMTNLGEFKDPGEVIEKDPRKWSEIIKNAQSVIDWYFQLAFRIKGIGYSENKELTSQQKKEIAKEILPVIKKIPDTIEQAHYVELLAKRLQVPDKIIFDALDRPILRQPASPAGGGYEGQAKKSQISEAHPKISSEEILVGLLTKKPEKIIDVSKKIKPEDFTNKLTQKIYKLLLNWYNENREKDLPAGEAGLKKFLISHLKNESENLELILFEIEENYRHLDLLQVIDDLSARMILNKKENTKDYYAREIAKAENAGDRVKLKTLIKEFQDAIK